MRHQDDGPSTAKDVRDGIVHDLTGIAVKAGVGLIQQQQVGRDQAHPRELRTPTHPRRTPAHHTACQRLEADAMELRVDLTTRTSEKIPDELQILVHGEVGM
ncbi:MAG: hypothetical protein V3S75_04055 [Euzebya tangerina]|nr:hypothetical protein [Euzebya tangerina]